MNTFNEIRIFDQQFYNLLEAMPDAMVVTDRNGQIILANTLAMELFSYTKESFIGMTIDLFLPERFRMSYAKHRADYIKHPHQRTMEAGLELFGLRSDKTEFPAEICMNHIHINNEIFVLSTIRNISERKKSDEKFHALVESVPDAVVIVDQQGNIVLVNSQTEKLFGYKGHELLGNAVEMLIPKRFSERHVIQREGYFSHPKVRGLKSGLELYGVKKDGMEFPVEISLSPMPADNGALVFSLIRDITERKQREELRRFELEEQNRRIQETTRLKSEFLANMSHELRTPLNGIIGFAEFLVDEKPGPLNAKQKEYLLDILSSGKHLLQLLNDILDLAKVEAGKISFVATKFSVKRTIDEVCSIIHPTAVKKNISVTVETTIDPDIVSLDQQKFKQVLYNLLSNAVKFTHHGGSVHVGGGAWSEDRFCIQVSDTGIGIRKEDIPKLFNEFQQIDSGMTKQFEGTGLGLAITKKFVELQQGFIQVKSEFGKGSVFIVVLPKQFGEIITP